MKTLALDLGGTRIKMGIVERDKILASSIIDALSAGGLQGRLPDIEEAASGLLGRVGEPVAGMGISAPGIVDPHASRVTSINAKYADAVGFDFPSWAKKSFGLPLRMENDARSALVGEWQFGAGRGCNNLVMVTLGTGIGGAAMIDGKLLYGKHFQAGCLGGHFTIDYEGDECNCGNIGCAESIASSWALPLRAKRDPAYTASPLSKGASLDYRALLHYSDDGDSLSQRLLQESLRAWTMCVINLIHAYDPEMVILGGGLMQSAEAILPAVRDGVHRHAWTPWGKVQILKARDTENAALLGISYLLEQSIR